jgi:hypothetical protein
MAQRMAGDRVALPPAIDRRLGLEPGIFAEIVEQPIGAQPMEIVAVDLDRGGIVRRPQADRGERQRPERYRRADLFMRGGLGQFVVDDNLQARFVADGRGVLYRHGKPGQRVITYLTLADRKQKVVAIEADLVRQVSAALPTPPASPPRIEVVDFDPRTGALTFTAADRPWKSARGDLIEVLGPGRRSDPVARRPLRDRRARLQPVRARAQIGREVALTADGTREQPYGRGIPQLGDILKAGTEEPKMPVSVQWSPDSRQHPELAARHARRRAAVDHAREPTGQLLSAQLPVRVSARRRGASCRRRRASPSMSRRRSSASARRSCRWTSRPESILYPASARHGLVGRQGARPVDRARLQATRGLRSRPEDRQGDGHRARERSSRSSR